MVFALSVQNCSRKKDTFINRNFHALGTKYNILYNGNIALEQGKASVNNAFTENFWQLLPVERMEVKDEVSLPGQTKNQDFERAEEKAIKAVQLHGMNINGKEKNPQIDEAYLLLGKARYFDQRFIPALEAFNYILYKYPASDKINHAKVWREKTNMRLDNNKLAIKNLKRILEQEELEEQDLADVSATLAQAYINIKAKDSAVNQLQIAAENTKIKNERARYNYIIGQLYDEFGKKDSANMAYDKIIKMHRKIPRAFYINAHLAKSKNFDAENGDKVAFLEYLTKMEENRENRPFLDKVYYRIAEFHRTNDSLELAEAYYNKSIRTKKGDKYLNALNYGTLGDMYFDKAIYKTAGAYYDSTMLNMVKNTKPYRVVKKKRENLDDVIYYEEIAQVNDSILNLISLPKEEQLAVFEALTERLKAEAIAKQEEEKNNNNKPSNNTINSGVRAKSDQANKTNIASRRLDAGNIKGPKENFYFYNPTTVAYGRNEFLKTWGDRKLQDNWRLSNERSSKVNKAVDELVAVATDDERYDPNFYISKLPTDSKEIDSIARERNYAYYQLGIIYKEKFSEYELAKEKLETLLKNDPEQRLILPSKYNLFRIYELLGLNDKATLTKNDIITNYADSRYAEILKNPDSQLSKNENSPEVIYEKLYEKFVNQEYSEVISSCSTEVKRFEGDPIVPKLEILKASAKGRLYGLDSYKESINYIALTYPNTEEGKKAQTILQNAIPAMANAEFVADEASEKFNVIYEFDNNTDEDIEAFMALLNKKIEKIKYFDLSVSKDVYDENRTFVVVHGLKSIGGATGFAQLLRNEKDKKDKNDVKITKPYFAISSPNYAIIQRHKNLNDYLKPQ